MQRQHIEGWSQMLLWHGYYQGLGMARFSAWPCKIISLDLNNLLLIRVNADIILKEVMGNSTQSKNQWYQNNLHEGMSSCKFPLFFTSPPPPSTRPFYHCPPLPYEFQSWWALLIWVCSIWGEQWSVRHALIWILALSRALDSIA